jgi:hypothetical protein
MGPVSMTYKGDVEIVEADEAEHRAILRTNAREARGQGTAKATVELRLAEADGKTRGTIHADVSLSGRAASMGRGIIQDVSAKMIDTFAQNLAAMLTGPAPASETGNGSAPTSEAAATATATMPRQQQQAAPADALDAGELARGMLLARLRDPRVVGVIGVVLLILLLRRRR